jgi:hypothetical protein
MCSGVKLSLSLNLITCAARVVGSVGISQKILTEGGK